MTSDRKRTANQANAKKSTGPTSPAGKRKAARNAMRHGLTVKAPDQARSATARSWAETYCREDPGLNWPAALAIAEALLRTEEVARAEQDLTELLMESAFQSGSPHPAEDLARLAMLSQLSSIDGYARRVAGSVRKALRRS